jgi:hypothetical protein
MTLRSDWARAIWRWSWLVMTAAAACSFQDFGYLQEPADETGGTNSGGASGVSGTSGTSGTSGSSSESGASGTSATGGRGGSSATGGDGGDGEMGGEAGSGPAGGASGSGSGGAGMGGMMGGMGGSGGMGAVGQLLNPSFESFNTMGWTVEPASALTNRYIFVQAPTGTVPAPDGAYELATWHQTDGFQVEIHQTVLGLEDGTYTFQGWFSRGDGFNDIYMFARECGGTDPEPLPIPLTDPSSFELVALTGIEVVGGSCKVGIYVDSNLGNWMNADKFSLQPE